jgi:hypothetical protein
VELKDIKVGERYRYEALSNDVTVKSVEADYDGYIAAMRHTSRGDTVWALVHPMDLRPIVRRYTVELRPPKAGERYFCGGIIDVSLIDADNALPVIVDGDQ